MYVFFQVIGTEDRRRAVAEGIRRTVHPLGPSGGKEDHLSNENVPRLNHGRNVRPGHWLN